MICEKAPVGIIVHSSSVEMFGKPKCKVPSESMKYASVSAVKLFTPSAKILRVTFFLLRIN
jgi:hypothetical protein